MSYAMFGYGAFADALPPPLPLPAITFGTVSRNGLLRPDSMAALDSLLGLASWSQAPTGPGTPTYQAGILIPANPFDTKMANAYATKNAKIAQGFAAVIQLPPQISYGLIFTKDPSEIAAKTRPGGGFVLIDGPPALVAAAESVAGGGEVPPVNPNAVCPPGTLGIPPACVSSTPCGPGTIGVPPLCFPNGQVPAVCPPGSTGTPPFCQQAIAPVCPPGTKGTPPTCRKEMNLWKSPYLWGGVALFAAGGIAIAVFSKKKKSSAYAGAQ